MVDQAPDLRTTIRFNNFYVDALSKSVRLPHEKHFKPRKVFRDPGVSTILASKSPWCHSAVQICGSELQKLSRHQFLAILTSESSSATAWCKLWRHLRQPILPTRPFLGAEFPSQRNHKTMEKQHVAQFLPAKTTSSRTTVLCHICVITSVC